MELRPKDTLRKLRASLRMALSGPAVLAFLPALVLGGFWLGGEAMLIMIALGFPLCLAFAGLFDDGAGVQRRTEDTEDDFESFQLAAEDAMSSAAQSSRKTGCVMLMIDDFDAITERYGKAATETMMAQTCDRIKGVLRTRDRVCRMSDNHFGIILAPVRQLNLGNGLHLASRLQSAVEEPFALDATTVYVSASLGLALDTNLAEKTGTQLLEAAQIALNEATRHAPSALRAYSQEMRGIGAVADVLSADLEEALENGEIQAWFQPQISTDTGLVTGFEALARWCHPVRGMVTPAEFLPSLEKASRMGRLGEVILHQALSAIKSWDAAGLNVPHVGVNFSPEELRNPRLVEKIEWELDRFDLSPDRLTIEILETVVATSPDDTIVRNISGLSDLGCLIDLDDFGTGHASISSIRRFDVQRLKIDRSFVMKVDRDAEQQRMVSAILLMAERLDLDTLAEGVETAGEHAMLSQLGCGHVQGFGIGRPMPFDQCADWIAAHTAKLSDPPVIGRQTG